MMPPLPNARLEKGEEMAQVALLTGASGDIGQAIASRLGEDGYHLYLHYHHNYTAVLELKNQLEKLYPDQRFSILKADLRQTTQAIQLFEQLGEGVDLFIYNSGKSHIGLVTDVTDALAQEFIDLHLTSPFLLTKRLLPYMVRQKAGNIIFITSIWGLTGASTEVLYSMVKGGQNSFIKGLAKEVAPSGIQVNAVAPGAIDTKMLSNIDPDDLTLLKEEIPMGRLGEPKEVAELVGFLASDKSQYINGQIISINGAWY